MMKKEKSAYLIGIKGVAMTSLAIFLHEKGYMVTGSDVKEEFITDPVLSRAHIKIRTGFAPENIPPKTDTVIITGAHGGRTNIEARTACEHGIPTLMHGEYIGKLMDGKIGISVAGCHGKTTTSSLIALLLVKSGRKPSYLVGTSQINRLGPGGHFDIGKYIVMEADEYMTCPKTDKTPRFLWQHPKILVITNIEYDHPDAYKNLDEVRDAFMKLSGNVKKDGVIIACIDSPEVKNLLRGLNGNTITYGFSKAADYCIEKIYFGQGVTFIKIKNKNFSIGEFMLRIPGKHNALDALAAMIAVNQAGISWEKIRELVQIYTGCKRRFEKIGEMKGVYLYDDYAHHPTEIMATIRAVKNWYADKRLIVVFQPHTFSRTKALFNEFSKAFTGADIVIIPDIYPSARETFDKTVNSNMLVSAINKNKNNARYLDDKTRVLDYIGKTVRFGDIILTLGAGDIISWIPDLKTKLTESL